MARTPPFRGRLDSEEDRSSPEPDAAPAPNTRPSPNDQTNPRLVKGPVVHLIHENFAGVKWKIYKQHQMCYIFDCVTPGRQWKRNSRYSDADLWATYGSAPWPDLTETDEKEYPQQPYFPREYE